MTLRAVAASWPLQIKLLGDDDTVAIAAPTVGKHIGFVNYLASSPVLVPSWATVGGSGSAVDRLLTFAGALTTFDYTRPSTMQATTVFMSISL